LLQIKVTSLFIFACPLSSADACALACELGSAALAVLAQTPPIHHHQQRDDEAGLGKVDVQVEARLSSSSSSNADADADTDADADDSTHATANRLTAEIATLTADRDGRVAEIAALEAQLAALADEREQEHRETAEQIAALAAERDSLFARANAAAIDDQAAVAGTTALAERHAAVRRLARLVAGLCETDVAPNGPVDDDDDDDDDGAGGERGENAQPPHGPGVAAGGAALRNDRDDDAASTAESFHTAYARMSPTHMSDAGGGSRYHQASRRGRRAASPAAGLGSGVPPTAAELADLERDLFTRGHAAAARLRGSLVAARATTEALEHDAESAAVQLLMTLLYLEVQTETLLNTAARRAQGTDDDASGVAAPPPAASEDADAAGNSSEDAAAAGNSSEDAGGAAGNSSEDAGGAAGNSSEAAVSPSPAHPQRQPGAIPVFRSILGDDESPTGEDLARKAEAVMAAHMVAMRVAGVVISVSSPHRPMGRPVDAEMGDAPFLEAEDDGRSSAPSIYTDAVGDRGVATGDIGGNGHNNTGNNDVHDHNDNVGGDAEERPLDEPSVPLAQHRALLKRALESGEWVRRLQAELLTYRENTEREIARISQWPTPPASM
jgi:hypothetical protein